MFSIANFCETCFVTVEIVSCDYLISTLKVSVIFSICYIIYLTILNLISHSWLENFICSFVATLGKR